MKILMFSTFLFMAIVSNAASFKGNGYLPNFWRVGLLDNRGNFQPMCESRPFVSATELTITCGIEGLGGESKPEGSGRLFGWRIAAPDGYFWRTICNNPFLDPGQGIIYC